MIAMATPLLLTGCGKSGRGAAREFIELITRSTKLMTVASRELGDVIEARLNDKATDADLKKAFAEFRQVIAEQRQVADTWKVPETPEGLDLLDTYRSNLDHRMALLDEYGPRIAESLARVGMGRSERAASTKKIVDELTTKSDADTVALRTAQRRYSTSMGIFTTK